MRVAVFCHSVISDWNNERAHFMRGVVTELLARRHDVRVFERRDAWSVENLLKEHGDKSVDQMRGMYPRIRPKRYDLATLDLDAALDDVDLVLVQDWNDAELVKRIGERRQRPGARFKALFHDTHHRSAADGVTTTTCEVDGYDGVLAIGAAVRDAYQKRSSSSRTWIWHEAADPRVFFPVPAPPSGKEGDVVWIGACDDAERAGDLREYLGDPVRELGVAARAYGPRFPSVVTSELSERGIGIGGWVPSFRIPDVFARFRCAVHVPDRARARALEGTPDIRVFEALACAIPLACGPWSDIEGLFTAGRDYLAAVDAADMRRHLKLLVNDVSARSELARHGRSTILARHTCAHRVDELISIAGDLGVRVRRPVMPHEGAHV